MKRLLAIAAMATMIVIGHAIPGADADGGWCTEDEVRTANLCIHVEGDGVRYLGR